MMVKIEKFMLLSERDDDNWKEQLTKSVWTNFMEKEFTDVTLEASNGNLEAHMMILSAFSPFFKAHIAFNEKFNKENKNISLKSFRKEHLEVVLEFMYKGIVQNITEDNVVAILQISDFLEVSNLKRACCRYIKKSLNTGNCLEYYEMAENHQTWELKHYCFKYAIDNLSKVLKEDYFLEIQPSTLSTILKSRVASVETEGELLEAVLKWCSYDDSTRKDERISFLGTIQEQNLNEEEKVKFRSEFPEGELEIAFSHETVERFRREQEVVILFGGESLGRPIQPEMHYFLHGRPYTTLKLSRWQFENKREGNADTDKIILANSFHRMCCTIAVKNNIVYLMGGRDKNSVFITFCETYNIETNSYSPLPSLPIGMNGNVAVNHMNQIWLLGGKTEKSNGKTMYVLDESNMQWISKGYMPEGLLDFGMVSLHGHIYVLGGTIVDEATGKSTMPTNSCYKYDSYYNTWEEIAPMTIPRSYFGAVVLNDTIYAVGGCNGKSFMSEVERYDPVSNKWTDASPMLTERSSFGITVLDGYIYCTGGFTGCFVDITSEIYSDVTNTWRPASKPMHRRYGSVAATVTRPFDRIDPPKG